MVMEDYVSFETAKLLKEKGFREWCFRCYGVAVLHNGVTISFDEECELKDEGRENEIEYVEGGVLYNCSCNNSDKDAKVWAAPTQQMALKWLRENHDLHLEIHRFNKSWFYMIIDMVDDKTLFSEDCGTYDECIDNGLKYCLENLV